MVACWWQSHILEFSNWIKVSTLVTQTGICLPLCDSGLVLICVLCCMWPCMLHACCVPSLLPQMKSAVILAHQSTMPCVVLGVSWVAASHTQQWYPSTLSSAVCRFVWKLKVMVATNSQQLNSRSMPAETNTLSTLYVAVPVFYSTSRVSFFSLNHSWL